MHDSSTATLAEAQQRNHDRVRSIDRPNPERAGNVTRGLVDRLTDPDYQAMQRRKRELRERKEAEREQANRASAWQTLAAKIGRRHAACSFDNFIAETDRQREALQAAKRFHGELQLRIERGCNLLIFGPVGTGKDHLMVSLVRDAVLSGASATWVSGLDLWGDVRDMIGAKKREEAFVRQLSQPDILALSDPSSEGDALTQFQRAFLQRLIDRRYRYCKSTWITINVTDRAAMESAIGVPTVDRLGHDCLAIHCDWESYRRSAMRRNQRSRSRPRT